MVEILEQGAVSFLALPRPGVGDPAGARDVARLYLVLAPSGRKPLRRIEVRRARLPDAARGQRRFAHVDRIAVAAARLTDDVHASGPRVLAVGRYALALHGEHVHLAYALARVCRRGALAASLGIAPGASWVVYVFRRSLPPIRRPGAREPLAAATPERLDVIGADVALVSGGRPGDARLGITAAHDRVGDALVGALLRRGPRPRIASFARAGPSRRPPPARRGGAQHG